jgi:hypothetical protein
MPCLRPLPEEHNSPQACNDTDAHPTLRTRAHRIALAAPLQAQAGTEVHTGLSSYLSPDPLGALDRDAKEVLTHAARHPGEGGHLLYDHDRSLRKTSPGGIRDDRTTTADAVMADRGATRPGGRRAVRGASAPGAGDTWGVSCQSPPWRQPHPVGTPSHTLGLMFHDAQWERSHDGRRVSWEHRQGMSQGMSAAKKLSFCVCIGQSALLAL